MIVKITTIVTLTPKCSHSFILQYDGDTGLWEDEDTRTFYENLKDLKSLVPSVST